LKTTQDEHHWPCTACGADLTYAPGQTNLVCEHCGHAQAIEPAAPAVKARALGEIPLERGLAETVDDAISDEARSTSCPTCGALVEFSGASHASDCPYCATPVVVDTGTYRRLKPQALVPFSLTEDQARDALSKWLGGLWFAPNGLLEYTRKGRKMAGIYVPFWSFDADTKSRYTGQRGEHYTETRTVSVVVNGKRENREEQVQKTRWHATSGKVARFFDDMLVMASKSLPKRLGNELTSWDLGKLEAYSTDYLAGFQAEGYTILLHEGHLDARSRMESRIEADVRRDIGGDEQRITWVDTTWQHETFKHILLPVWTAAYKYSGKSFQFLVNGQTGEVQGERPYSWWKIGFAVLAVAVTIGVAVYLNDPSVFGL
jgi:DNA-directed RNA polymerase subunit RPC12/RpoP